MITQIYSILSVEEALACVDAGADHVGILVSRQLDGRYPCQVLPEPAKDIFQALKGKAVSVLISVDKTPEEIIEMTKYLQPDILHLCAEYEGNAEFRALLAKECPDVRLMEAVGVVDWSAVEDAKKKAEYADLLILDSVSKDVPGVGAAGVTHDWSIDKTIIEEVNIPVIVAGGLGPENVAEAIQQLHPWGVDSLTKTSFKVDGKLAGKDIAKVKEFCDIAKRTA